MSQNLNQPMEKANVFDFLKCMLQNLLDGKSIRESLVTCLAVDDPARIGALPDMCDQEGLEVRPIWAFLGCLISSLLAGVPLVDAISACASAPAPTPAPPAVPKIDPWNALGRLQVDGVGCTGTVLRHGKQLGSYLVLTAAHCLRGTSGKGTITMRQGGAYPVSALVIDSSADLAVMRCDTNAELPQAEIAERDPANGTRIWHGGWGVAAPGQRKSGTVSGQADANGQIRMTVSASGGDSGGGIFRDDTGELISVVCCGGGGILYGGGVSAILNALSKVTNDLSSHVQPSDLAPYLDCICDHANRATEAAYAPYIPTIPAWRMAVDAM